MSVLEQVATTKTKYQINIFHTRPGFPENVVFLKCYFAMSDDREELMRIYWHAFEQAHPTWAIKSVEAVAC